MNTEVFKQFLVSIGWSNDDAALKKVLANVDKLEKTLIGVAAVAEATSLSVAGFLVKMSEGFERLFYSSQRSNSTVKELNALKYAASQMGASAASAMSAVEGLSQKIRENRGYLDFVQRITGDKGNDIAKQIVELGQAFHGMSSERAHANAAFLGIPEDLLLAIQRPEFGRSLEEYGQKASGMGVDLQKAAEDGKNLSQALRSVRSTLDLITDAAATPLFQQLDEPIRKLNAFLEKNGKRIAEIIGEIAAALLRLTTFFLEHLPDAEAFVKAIGGWEVALGALATVIALRVIPGLNDLFGVLGKLALLSTPWWLKITTALVASNLTPYAHTGENDVNNAYGPTEQSKALDKMSPGERIKKLWQMRPKFLGGTGGVLYKATSMTGDQTGITPDQYSAYKEGLTDIEGKRYDRMGGAGGHYAGRYQMGAAEITDTAARLGVPRPSNEQFLADPQMQERFMESYTLNHYQQLMKNPKFAAMSAEGKLKMLGYAHNQGVGDRRRGTGAMGYLDSGRVGSDAFGTKGTAYFGTIGRRLEALKNRSGPVAAPKSLPQGANAFGKGLGGFNPDAMHSLFDSPPLPLGGHSFHSSQSFTNSPNISVVGVSDPQKAADLIQRGVIQSHDMMIDRAMAGSAIG